MFKKIIPLLLFSMLLVSSCEDDKPDHEIVNKTVLIYMVADNSLSGYVEPNLDSIAIGYGISERIGNLIVYVDETGVEPTLYKYVREKGKKAKLVSLRTYPESNAVSIMVMQNVFREVFTEYPALSYGLVLWSHGTGWIPSPNSKPNVAPRSFGQDGTNYMDIPDLAQALTAAPKFDFILFDACFMSDVEIAYELREQTKYLIASPTEVWAYGFPYSQIIEPMFAGDYEGMTRAYSKYYNGVSYDKTGSIALIDCREMEQLAKENRKIISNHVEEFNNVSSRDIQRYDRYAYPSGAFLFDYYHFMESIATKSELTALKQQLDKTIAYKQATPRFSGYPDDKIIELKNFSGVGCYIPYKDHTSWLTAYHTFGWYKAAGWNLTKW